MPGISPAMPNPRCSSARFPGYNWAMPKPTRYREIEVAGSPREMGRQIGEAAREEIRGFAAVALDRVNKTVKVSREKALEVAVRAFRTSKATCLPCLKSCAAWRRGPAWRPTS